MIKMMMMMMMMMVKSVLEPSGHAAKTYPGCHRILCD